MKLKLTKLEKRFLIIWTCIHCFALFVNLADFDYCITTNKPTDTELDSLKFKSTKYSFLYHTEYKYYVLTSGGNTNSSFWPLTVVNNDSNWNVFSGENLLDITEFLGVFNGYNYFSFACYLILGFGIILIRKIW